MDNKEKCIGDMANVYYDAMLKARGTLGSMNEGAPKWYAKHFYEAGYRRQEWISVEERLPEIMETVLIAYKEKWEWETKWNFGVDAGSWDIVEGRWNTYHDVYEGQELQITHWMPLPQPPETKGETE